MRRGAGVGLVGFAAALVVVLASVATFAWQPAPPDPPPTVTDEQRAEAVRQQVDSRWLQLADRPWRLDPPQIEVVRYTGWADAEQSFADCMTSSGYLTRYSPEGGLIGPAVGADQLLSYDLFKYTCLSKYPQDPVQLGYLNPAQAEFLYNYRVNSLAPCLRSLGVVMPEPPRPDFSGDGASELAQPWDPYENADELGRGVLLPHLMSMCPPFPRQP